jgi:hypothetical protein
MGRIAMDYEQYRASLIKGYYAYQLETLMSGFDPDRKTVILLPGGMGSQLERTEHAYPANPNVINDVIWLDLGIAFPKYDGLKMEADDAEKDKDEFVVAAHGPLSFLTQTPYGEPVSHPSWERTVKERAATFHSTVHFASRLVRKFLMSLSCCPCSPSTASASSSSSAIASVTVSHGLSPVRNLRAIRRCVGSATLPRFATLRISNENKLQPKGCR